MTIRILHKTRARLTHLAGPRALVEAREALASAESAQHQVLRRVAHDLRNPLNSILLMAQLLEEIGGSEDAVRIARRIQKQCDEMNSLVNKVVERVPG